MNSRNHLRAHRRGAAILAALAGVGSMAIFGVAPASADPVSAGSAKAIGAELDLGGEPRITLAEAEVTAIGDAEDTTIPVDGGPLVINGTFNADANVHGPSDIESALEVNEQEVAGPYNARGVGSVEELEVLITGDVPVGLLSADVLRGEAVAVCTAGSVQYSANSEIVNLVIGGADGSAIPLNAPLEQIVDAINTVLTESGLSAAANVERNVVTPLEGGGIAVDALVVTIADGAIGQLRFGHGEVGPLSCATQCTDGIDNDGDGGRIDIDDPACHTDRDETNPASYDPTLDSEDDPECSDNIDNADPEDELADRADPGCHTDGDASNADSYDPFDDDETDVVAAEQLPRTGGTPAGAFAGAGLLAAALGAFALRRRATA